MTAPTWVEWHDRYRDPNDPISERLLAVRRAVAAGVASAPPGPVTVIDLCAGQGEASLPPLTAHGRAADVRLLLVELDPRNAAAASARAAGTDAHVEVVVADAGEAGACRGHVPARVVLLSGVLGHLAPDDRERFIGLLPMLCDTGALVIWTRNPAAAVHDRRAFAAAGFTELSFEVADRDGRYGVGCHRFDGVAPPFDPGRRLFTFLHAVPTVRGER